MKTPEIEEVREYFKNAKVIESLFGDKFEGFKQLHIWLNQYYVYDSIGKSRLLWDKKRGYAKIIEYKEPKEEDKPKRYKEKEINGMDVIDLIKYWNLNFNEGNILKYLLRNKGERESDLLKISDYAQREYKHLNNN